MEEKQIYTLNSYEVKLKKPTRAVGEDEYIAPNNVIFCKHCETPRQCVISAFGELKVRPVMCRCQCEEEALLNAKRKREELKRQIEYNRFIGIRIEKYRQFTFENDNGKAPKMLEMCKKYVAGFDEHKNDGQGLLFLGSYGTGKTYYAHAIANALIDMGYKVKSTSMSEIVSDFQDWDNAEYNFQTLLMYDCIVIDDLGTERDTSFSNEKMYRFFNEANVKNIPLIVTTNQSVEDFEKATNANLEDGRIFSRILEKCRPVAVDSVKQRKEQERKNRVKFNEVMKNTEIDNFLSDNMQKYYNSEEPYWCK